MVSRDGMCSFLLLSAWVEGMAVDMVGDGWPCRCSVVFEFLGLDFFQRGFCLAQSGVDDIDRAGGFSSDSDVSAFHYDVQGAVEIGEGCSIRAFSNSSSLIAMSPLKLNRNAFRWMLVIGYRLIRKAVAVYMNTNTRILRIKLEMQKPSHLSRSIVMQ